VTCLIKNSQYKFKPARQIKIDRANSTSKRVLTITNSRDKIIQKAVSILLELIYEKSGIFLEVSHGFRPGKSCHTALKQIKYGWSAIP
jgi:RNA-directed DNA polymerase